MGLARQLGIATLVALTGCNAIFGLDAASTGGDDDPPAGDGGGSIDAAGPDAMLGAWGAPSQLAVAATADVEEDPIMSADGTELYFAWSPVADPAVWDIRRSVWTGSAWGTAAPVSILAQSSYYEATPRFAHGDTVMYLTSDRVGTLGGHDLFVTTRPEGGSWSVPTSVGGDPINSAANERGAAPCMGQSRLVFSSDRLGSLDLYEVSGEGVALVPVGGAPVVVEGSPFVTEDCLTLYYAASSDGTFDLYVSERDRVDLPWTISTKIAELSGAESNEFDPWVSADGRTILFSSDADGDRDIYMATR